MINRARLAWGGAILAAATVLAVAGTAQAGATLVADYEFNGNLNSSVGGPALTAVNPASGSGFSGGLYTWTGTTTPANQGGLTFNNAGNLIDPTDYSIALRFEFTSGTGNSDGWRRIIDVQNRGSDDGFYVDPSNNLDVFPVAGNPPTFNNDQFENVLLTNSGGVVTAYLNGVQAFQTNTTVMDIDSNDLVNLFLDNTAGGGQGEWSGGTIDYARFYNGVATLDQVAAGAGAAPEPATWAFMLTGVALAGAGLRAARRKGLATAAI